MHRRALRVCLLLALILVGCVEAGTSTRSPAHDPYPYTIPTPPPETTPIDGVYARTVTADQLGGAGACRRCPPYRLAPGEDILGLELGVFEVYHRGTGYLSVGHFISAESTVTFFNDPNCPRDRGTYQITAAQGGWSFETIDDPCPYDNLRAQFLTSTTWKKLEPPEGIYTSTAGEVLMLLNGRFALDGVGPAINGAATRTGELVTIEAGACRQEFEWSFDRGTLTLATNPPVCETDWVPFLVDTQWRGVG